MKTLSAAEAEGPSPIPGHWSDSDAALSRRYNIPTLIEPKDLFEGDSSLVSARRVNQCDHKVLEEMALAVTAENPFLVLNQYRAGSSYKDEVGSRYHFPKRYLNNFSSLPARFVYYEPRSGGSQEYFGTGAVHSCVDDTEEADHFYLDVDGYIPFPAAVDYFTGPGGVSWEPAKTMRNSVRRISAELFFAILSAGGITKLPPPATPVPRLSRLETELASLMAGSLPPAPTKLRRVQRILESVERPSSITNAVKRHRGDECQLCGASGFPMRNGNRYCEIHHLFHLSEMPPPVCLGPEFLVVLCATCHRRMHFGNVGQPIETAEGWLIEIDREIYRFKTRFNSNGEQAP